MEENRKAVMTAKGKTEINKRLNIEVNGKYHEAIPIKEINNIIKFYSHLELLQEDRTAWSGFLCGDAATVMIDIGIDGGSVCKRSLFLQWYKMPSGRYEVTCYVS